MDLCFLILHAANAEWSRFTALLALLCVTDLCARRAVRALTMLQWPRFCAVADVGVVVLLRRVVHAVPESAGHPHHHAADAAVRRLRGGSPGVAGGARWVQSLVWIGVVLAGTLQQLPCD